jgi:hypothetical protein
MSRRGSRFCAGLGAAIQHRTVRHRLEQMAFAAVRVQDRGESPEVV